MRAGRCRGSPRRSPSSANDLKHIAARQRARQTCRAFCLSQCAPWPQPWTMRARSFDERLVPPSPRSFRSFTRERFCHTGNFHRVAKSPCRPRSNDVVARKSSAHRSFPGMHDAGGYPAKRVSKSGDSLITYPHSDVKHLENQAARRAREGFVNIFWRPSENCHTSGRTFESLRRFKTLLSSL